MAAASEAAPIRQAVILAAGRSQRLAPYTDSMPGALISIAEKPMVAHSMAALRRRGVESFIICRGWQGTGFDAYLSELGEGVELVECPLFATTGMLESLRRALQHLKPGGFYLAYGDIIFRPNILRQLSEANGHLSVVVNAWNLTPGSQSKGSGDVEVVSTFGEGPHRIVRRIGKNRRVKEAEIAGEFAGLAKFSAEGRSIIEAACGRIWSDPSKGACTGEAAAPSLPWWLEPIQEASLCDLFQLLADEGVSITPAMAFGGWHEVNTPQDLTRARNDTAMFLSEADERAQVAAMGACLLSEANDLKRPLSIVAKELNFDLAKLECLLRGDLQVNDALDVLKRMSEVYPVPLNDLWLDADDTLAGVRLQTAEASEASSRILTRPDRTGGRSPYYEYRDAAMSRCSQFRPEWIKQLRFVQGGNPKDPDVQLNNGHLMMQTTLFVGPVDFWWQDQHGCVHCREMRTGDSNFISPYVPHSFTTREQDTEALIIAVTYGGNVRRAFTEFTRVGAHRVFPLAGDKRDPALTRRCVLNRHLAAECMSAQDLERAVGSALPAGRVATLLEGEEASHEELEVLAAALHVRLSDLHVCEMEESEETVVMRSEDSHAEARHLATYTLAPLARTRHQPDLKTFDLEVLDSATPGEILSCGLHTFVYHFGDTPVKLAWEDGARSALLRPGDSAYLAPLVEHRFSACETIGTTVPAVRPEGRPNPNGAACGRGRRLFVVRIPGHLTGETLSEFATFSAFGRERVGAETVQWYN